MFKFKKYLLVALVALSGSLYAAVDKFLAEFLDSCRAPMGSEVELGVWNGDLDACQALADEYGIPMVAVWSNNGCGHCQLFEKGLMSDAFKNWAKDCGLILCFTCSEDPLAGKLKGRYYYWFKEKVNIKSYPFVRLYWYKDGKMIADKTVVGDLMNKQQGIANKTYDKSGQNIVNYIMDVFNGYTPAPLYTYFGGTFDFEESANDRLELDKNSKTLMFDLVRDESVVEVKTNNTVKLVKADGTVLKSQKVDWAANQTNQTVSIAVSSYVSGLKDGDVLSLALVDADGTEQEQTNHVYFVEKETSTKNPLWIGERVAGSGKSLSSNPKSLAEAPVPALSFGEWTMDLDVAKQTAANADGQANTLALVAGTLWCPDCKNTDEQFLEYEENGTNLVQQWAKDNNVALAVVEMPRFTTNSVDSYVTATLLSRDAGASYYLDGTVSGRGYLTRKGVSDADAQAQLVKFHDLVTKNTAEGGFHRPEDGNDYRMGVPIFVMLRKDGTVAARLRRFADPGSPVNSGDVKNYLKRFDEMLAIAADEGENADPTEMENNYPDVGAIEFVANGGETNGVVSHCDFRDVFKLSGIEGGALQKVVVSGSDAAEVKVSYVKLDDKNKEVQVGDAVTGSLDAEGGVVLENEFSEKGDYYVKVEAADIDSEAFNVGNTNANNFFKYSISGSVVLVPQEQKLPANAAKDSDTVVMRLVKDKVYRIEGVNPADVTNSLAALDLEDPYCKFYTALKSGDCELKCAYGEGGSISYQIWNTGKVKFAETAKTVKENAGEVTVTVSRIDGSSGELKVVVTNDLAATTLYNTDGDPGYEFERAELVWKDGEKGDKTFTVKILDDKRYDYAESDLVLNLALAVGSVGELEDDVYVLTVTEDDERTPGDTGFIGSDPVFGKKGIIYAKESKGVEFRVGRMTGSDGAVSVEVASSLAGTTVSGDLEDGVISWESHKFEDKSISVSGIPAGKTAKITLKNPEGGLKIMSASNNVSVVSVPDSAPEFLNQEETLTLYRYVTSSNLFGLAADPSGKVTFKKLSGTLPAGLKATYDSGSNALLVWGTTTAKPGTYAVVYQAVDGSVAGLCAALTFIVADPTDAKASPDVANESVAKSRTFKNVALIDTADGRLEGILETLTIPANGKASAKLISANSTSKISLSSKNWSEYDPATKTLTVSLTAKGGWILDVEAENDDDVIGSLHDPVSGKELQFETDSDSIWSKDNPADDWKGYFTVALGSTVSEESREGIAPTGYGYMTLKMDTDASARKGEVTYTIMLPNGTAVKNKKAYLTKAGEIAYLPLLYVTATDVFSAVVALDSTIIEEARCVTSVEGVKPYWSHKEKTKEADVSWKVDFALNGGFYDKSSDLADCCTEDYTTDEIDLFFDTESLGSLHEGNVGSIAKQSVKVSTSSIAFTSPKPKNMKISSFNRATGEIKGTVAIPYGENGKTKSANWAGVVVQGFGEGCGCEEGGDDIVFLPFVCGSYFLKDKVEYQKGTRTQSINVLRGGSAVIDLLLD